MLLRSVRSLLPATLSLLALLSAAACADRPEKRAAPASPSPKASPAGDASIFAAASLTEAFNKVGEAFKGAHPGASVTFNFGASSTLAQQIVEQGGADVFASADEVNMKNVADKGLVEGTPQPFAQNRLQIIVPPGNPKRIAKLADLANPDLKVVLAAPQVPAGRYSREALGKAAVTVRPVSEPPDVKGVVAAVTLGEADAGIVYATDVRAVRERGAGIAIPLQHNIVARYPITLVRNSKNPEVGRAFIEFVLSDAGQKILSDHGFLRP